MIKYMFLLVLGLAQGAYQSVDEKFWKEASEATNDSHYSKVFDLADEKFKNTKKDSLEYAEASVALAQALSKANITFGATLVFVDVIKSKLGTQTALEALSGLEDIAKRASVDEDYVYGEVLNDLEFDNLTPELQSFVSFHQGMFNLLKGYNKWADEDFKKIKPNSYWDYKLKYLTALGEVARNRNDSAIERFANLSADPQAPVEIKIDAAHQFGRLVFEKGDYEQAYKIFKGVTLNPREKGLILLERAWTKYYQKDYSKALGLLAALESPIFNTARSPEPYILKMLMYKELCHYDAALQVVGNFNSRFGQSLKVIKKRQDLRKDQMLVNLSVLDRRIEKWVNYLNLLKEERASLREYNWESYSFYNDMLKKYDLKIKEINDRLSGMLLSKTREVANQLLDWQEQLTFLDYQTRMDSLRVMRSSSDIDIKPEEIPHMSFDKMFWENSGEYWLDELETYKVFVESKCAK